MFRLVCDADDEGDAPKACKSNGSKCMGCISCARMPVMRALCILLRHHLLPANTTAADSDVGHETARSCELATELSQHMERLHPGITNKAMNGGLVATGADMAVDGMDRSSCPFAINCVSGRKHSSRFEAARGLNKEQAVASSCESESGPESSLRERNVSMLQLLYT